MFSCIYADCFQVYYITPDVNSSACPSADTNSCYTLSEFVSTYHDDIQSDVNLQFLPGDHFLESALTVSNITNISLRGLGVTSVITCNGTASGLLFSNVTNVTIENLAFIKCGTPLPHGYKKLRASFVFLHGANVTLSRTTLLNSSDAGLIIINVRGYITLLGLNVSNAGHYGNLIRYENSVGRVIHLTITVNNSIFVNNTHPFHMKDLVQGGLTILINHCVAQISMNSNTFSRNSGGGNLVLILHNITDFAALKVLISDATIEHGRSVKGGGLYLSVNKQLQVAQGASIANANKTIIVIDGVIFDSNVAQMVGAGMYLEHKNYVTRSKHGGVALHSNEYTIAGSYSQITPEYRVELKESSFYNNGRSRTWKQPGNPTILVNSNKYFGVFVTNNDCSGIIAVGSNLVLGGRVTLAHNRGPSGGGILLCQNAVMYLRTRTTITIRNNSVQHAGGGISVENLCLQTRPPCFFQFENLNTSQDIETIKIHLYNNTALYAGHNLFGGEVDYCYMQDNPKFTQPSLNTTEVFYKIFNLSNAYNPLSVTSIPRHICFCENNKTNCVPRVGKISVYPGERFVIPVTVVGQLDGEIPGSVRVWMENQAYDVQDFFSGVQVQKVSRACSNLTYTFCSNLSRLVIKLGVENTGDISGYERSSHFFRRNFDISFKECPRGFKLIRITKYMYKCDCAFKAQLPDISCNIRTKSITKHSGKRWIGYDKAEIMFSEVCPFGYCRNDVVVIDVLHDEPDIQCAYNRTGILCGKCKANYSVMLGSVACQKCSNAYLSFILVFALAGLLLFGVLTLLNLTVSKGTLSGLIFYVNVIQSNSSFIFPTEDVFPTGFLKAFISWLNLNAGIATCFYNGMDTYSKAWLQFVFPLYN